MKIKMLFLIFIANLLTCATAEFKFTFDSFEEVIFAICVIHNGTIQGNIALMQSEPTQPVEIKGVITGLSPGVHGFHVHKHGDLSKGCKSTGSHYNTKKQQHGGPSDLTRHIGDLGNIIADKDGTANIDITDSLLNLSGPHSIMKRAILIHEKADDFGKGGNEDSKKTGNAGPPIACCVITPKSHTEL